MQLTQRWNEDMVFLPDGRVLCAQLAGPKLLLYVFHVC